MTHEQFIKLSTAKLAKQAGFDWESRFDNRKQRDEWQQVALVEVSDPDYNDAMGDPYSDEFIPFMSPTKFVMLPHVTQSVLQRWLREVKKVIVEPMWHIREQFYSCGIVMPEWQNWGDVTYTEKGSTYKEGFNTYEAALEAGLKKCLTLIIEKQ